LIPVKRLNRGAEPHRIDLKEYPGCRIRVVLNTGISKADRETLSAMISVLYSISLSI
jgi:hypothetical protein